MTTQMPWVTISPDLDSTTIFERRDVRELLVQIGPLYNMGTQLGPAEWHAILAVGAGLSNTEAVRVTDLETKVMGTLRDHPSLQCHFDMHHDTTLASFVDDEGEAFRINKLLVALAES